MQIWRDGRQASRQELGNRARPIHDGIHLVLTGLAIVLGLVLLIIWISRPIILENFAGNGSVTVPVIAFVIFIYVILVVGIRSSHHTSGDESNPWLSGLSMFAAAVLLVAAMLLPMSLLPHTKFHTAIKGGLHYSLDSAWSSAGISWLIGFNSAGAQCPSGCKQ